MNAIRDAEEDLEAVRLRTETFVSTLQKILPYTVPYVRYWAPACVLVVIATAAALLEPFLFGYAIDQAIVPRDWVLLKKIGIGFLAVECIRVAAQIGYTYLFARVSQGVMQDLRLGLFQHLMALPVAVYDRTPVGRLITRVTNDTAALADMFSAGFAAMSGNVLLVLGILAWLLALDFRLGLVTISVFPLIVIASVYFSRRLKVAYRDARTRLSALNAYLAENILGMRVVHLFGREDRHLAEFNEINQEYFRAQFATTRVFALFQPSITISAGASVALVMWYGGGLALQKAIPIGMLVAYFSYALTLFQPIREIADKWNIVLSGIAGAERIFSILEWPTEMPVARAQEPLGKIKKVRGDIKFENVWFAYDAENWVLKDFTVSIETGQKIGIVGHTGAGKTTLISLLLRLYEPQRGRILIDGRDIREYERRELRSMIGIIQQDVFLFSGSIRENLTLGREYATEKAEEQIRKTIERLDLSHWLMRGEGEMADLQERGTNLSMGERQVLAFTRAMAIDPSLWILDEATSSIDSRSEQELERAFREASKGRTAILIAHRLATVRDCNLILVLHRGVLVEQGKHSDLLAQDGLYARLFRFQEAESPLAAPLSDNILTT